MLDEDNWEAEKERLETFFEDGSTWLIMGNVGRWDGSKPAGSTFSTFREMWYKATLDCDYVKIYDENGHLYLTCSHHDGTNCFEIKRLTERGAKYPENWEFGKYDFSLKELHEKLNAKGYSALPNYAHQVFGCPKMEYEKRVA